MGSSAPSNTTQTTELPSWAQPYAKSLLERGAALSDQPMPVYGGQRSADMNGYQTTGMDMVANRALNGSSEIQSGSNQLQNTMNGAYLGYSAGTNPYMGSQSTATNAFMGDNPYLQSMIDKSAGDITKQYNGAVNSTDSNFARSGAFGGSAWQMNQQGNAHELANGLQNSSDNLRMQNYNQSAQLAESALARDQNYFNTNAQLAESGMNRNQQAFTNERANQMASIPLGLQYGNQAYTDAAQMQGVGAQQYAFDQQGMTDQQNLFNEYANAPYKSLDVLGNTIRGAVGGGGTTTSSAPGTNTAAQAAGGAAALYGLLK